MQPQPVFFNQLRIGNPSMCISLSVFSEVIDDDGGVSFLSQEGCNERYMECTFLGMHFLIDL